MNTPRFILLVCSLLLLFVTGNSFADSKYIANYYLATPQQFDGKTVKLDVVMVKPVHFQSPSPDLIFYRAETRDNWKHRHGGSILVAVLAQNSQKFAQKYGLVHQKDTTSLSGTFLTMPNRIVHGKGMSREYFIDTTGGKALSLLDQNPSKASSPQASPSP